MVVQTRAVVSASTLRARAAQPAQRRVARPGRIVLGAVVMLELAWLLVLAWGVYAIVF
jgi:hypothetical protein